MKNLSLKLKITLWYTIAMLLLSTFVVITINSVSNDILVRDISKRVEETVNQTAHMISLPRHSKTPPPPKFKTYNRGVHLMIFDDKNKLIHGTVPFAIEDKIDFNNLKPQVKTYDGNKYVVYDKPITLNNQTVLIKGMASVTDESYSAMAMIKTNIILALILILVASLGGYFIINRALAPVTKIRKTAKNISESNDLSQRINIPHRKDEISDLANTFDEMLDRIEQTMNREKQFTSDASHELRTPVSVILSECEYMADCATTDDEYKESAVSIKNQAEKMSKLISELLMISRMDKNSLQLNIEKTDISELLSFICEEQMQIHSKDITLNANIMPDIYADADKFLLARLFINLISNAYQYSHAGDEITVTLTESKDKVIFRVADTGIGIPEDKLSKIWERFYRVDSSRTASDNNSMGLGLAMVKEIAKLHNGEVSVTSKAGFGSTFTFIMPKGL